MTLQIEQEETQQHILEGIVETSNQKVRVFITNEDSSAHQQCSSWFNTFRPKRCEIVTGNTPEGTEAIQVIYIMEVS